MKNARWRMGMGGGGGHRCGLRGGGAGASEVVDGVAWVYEATNGEEACSPDVAV